MRTYLLEKSRVVFQVRIKMLVKFPFFQPFKYCLQLWAHQPTSIVYCSVMWEWSFLTFHLQFELFFSASYRQKLDTPVELHDYTEGKITAFNLGYLKVPQSITIKFIFLEHRNCLIQTKLLDWLSYREGNRIRASQRELKRKALLLVKWRKFSSFCPRESQ